MEYSFPSQKEIEIISALFPDGDNFVYLKTPWGHEIFCLNTREQVNIAKESLYGKVDFCPVYREGKQVRCLIFIPSFGIVHAETLKVLEVK